MLKKHTITTASYLFAFSVAFGAGVLSLAMTQLDNILYKKDASEDSARGTSENR